MQLILASASPARRSVLRAAGVDPVVRVSGVDEEALIEGMSRPDPARIVVELARAKADAVATEVASEYPDSVVVACDSMLAVPGPEGVTAVGKPGSVERARERWSTLAGSSAELLTGHAVVRIEHGRRVRSLEGIAGTTVRFGEPTEAELEAYLATGEPLQVAGAFTLDGLGGWFVEGVEGDPSNVVGISLPLTRKLLAAAGVDVVALWN
ncbi:Maf family protein [Actinoalloteichus spitiensis]|uniref:Maf family protein n=1 Tax=Actinoalloteichus spitiensis TaxID=252394 RepID=UPI000372D051|nr:Maf family protein [Actinoalloteichus spitiensis]